MNPLLWDLCHLKFKSSGCQRCDNRVEVRLLKLKQRGYRLIEVEPAEYEKRKSELYAHERYEDRILTSLGIENILIPKGPEERIVIKRKMQKYARSDEKCLTQ